MTVTFQDLERIAIAYTEQFGVPEFWEVSRQFKVRRRVWAVTLVFDKAYKFLVAEDFSRLLFIE